MSDVERLLPEPKLITIGEALKEQANRLDLRDLLSDAQSVLEDVKPSELASYLQRKLAPIGATQRSQRTMADIASAVLDVAENGVRGGISTHIPELDAALGGIYPGELSFIAARPSMGKTAFALHLMDDNAERGIPCHLYSLEMSAEDCFRRLICRRVPGVTMNDLRPRERPDGTMPQMLSAQQWEWVSGAAAALSDSPMTIDDTGNIGYQDVAADLPALKARGVKAVFIDGLWLMRLAEGNDTKANKIADTTRALKLAAKEHKMAIVVLHQLNRDVEKRSPPRPMMADLRDSGSIEQDADNIMFLFRPEYYQRIRGQAVAPDDIGKCEVIIGKNRNGPTTDVTLHFDKQSQVFGEWVEKDRGGSFGAW